MCKPKFRVANGQSSESSEVLTDTVFSVKLVQVKCYLDLGWLKC